MSQAEFEHRDPHLLASFLMSKTASVTASTIAQGRLSLIRLLRYLHDTGEDWDGQFGHLTELDLFGFLMTVHTQGTANATPGRSGADAVWGVFRGLAFLQPLLHLQLPLDQVTMCLPSSSAPRGQGVPMSGARPLPPETLPLLYEYVSNKSAPPVLRSWAFALLFSAVSSLRQANAQHISLYGTLTVAGKDFLLSQHADGKSRGKAAASFLTPLQDTNGNTAWFYDGIATLPVNSDFLWADYSGKPTSSEGHILPCPLPESGIQRTIHLVLEHACGMPAALAKTFTKHSARKTMVSLAQAAGCPWETMIELGHWKGATMGGAFVLPAEDLRRKKALECISLPARYSSDARLRRVARITSNQIDRLARYMEARKGSLYAPFDTRWELVPLFNPVVEGQ